MGYGGGDEDGMNVVVSRVTNESVGAYSRNSGGV